MTLKIKVAPKVNKKMGRLGLEPRTSRLKAGYSTN